MRNKAYKSAVKTLTKRYHEALEANSSEPSEEGSKLVRERMSAAVSKIDKAVKRGVLHKNAGARRKSRLAKALKTVEGTPTSADASSSVADTGVEEPVAEEPVAEETVAEEPVAEETVAVAEETTTVEAGDEESE